MEDPAAEIQPVNNDINNDGDGDGNVPTHNAQAVQGADWGINLKVEQTKLPEFWGQEEKDSITPNAMCGQHGCCQCVDWSHHILKLCSGSQRICQHLVRVSGNAGGYHGRSQGLDHHSAAFQNRIHKEKEDQVKISAIKEELRGSVLSIAIKILFSEHLILHRLS